MSFLQSDDESGSDDDRNWKRKPNKKKCEEKTSTLSWCSEEKNEITKKILHVSILFIFKSLNV